MQKFQPAWTYISAMLTVGKSIGAGLLGIGLLIINLAFFIGLASTGWWRSCIWMFSISN